MKIKVASNQEIKCIRSKCTPWILISDYLNEYVGVESCNLLPISFVDLTPLECTGPFEHFKDDICSIHHILEIVEFTKKMLNNDLLYISCDVGVSRSSAIANGLIRVFSLNQPVFGPPMYRPNPWITSLFLKMNYH